MTETTSLDFLRGNALGETWRICEALSRSSLLPKEYVGKPENVMISVMVANRMQIDPFTIMQNISVINGRPMFSTQFLLAMANKSKIFQNPIDWEVTGEGESLAVTAHAVLSSTGKQVSEKITFAMAKADGWTRNAKYQSMPVRMLKYRSASALIGLYAPELKMGFTTDEEAETIDVTPTEKPSAETEEKLAAQIGETVKKPRSRAPKLEATPINAEPESSKKPVHEEIAELQKQIGIRAGEIYQIEKGGQQCAEHELLDKKQMLVELKEKLKELVANQIPF